MANEIEAQASACMRELLDAAGMAPGDILVVGSSTSEVMGRKIGSAPDDEAAGGIFAGVYPLLQERGVWLAAQCCEHLNRALVIEGEAASAFGLPVVTAIPEKTAGGSWAAKVYRSLRAPVVVEDLGCHKAAAGIDIGETCIGMHLKPVAVMVRPSSPWVGEARVTMARTRPKLIGGERARYK